MVAWALAAGLDAGAQTPPHREAACETPANAETSSEARALTPGFTRWSIPPAAVPLRPCNKEQLLAELRSVGPHLGPVVPEHRVTALMRLTEDYACLTRITAEAADELDADIAQALQAHNNAQVASLRQRQQALRTEAGQYREQLIRTLQNLVETAPGHERIDEALALLGSALQGAGRPDEALQVYRTLINRFPRSPHVVGAHHAFAEHFFAVGEPENAQPFYERAAASEGGDAALGAYARYRLAWVYARRGEPTAALAHLFSAVTIARGAAAPQLASFIATMVREAPLLYADAHRAPARPPTPRVALAAFRRIAASAEEALEMFERMAERLRDTGRWPDAVAAYRHLAAIAPAHERASSWRAEAVRAIGCQRSTTATPPTAPPR